MLFGVQGIINFQFSKTSLLFDGEIWLSKFLNVVCLSGFDENTDVYGKLKINALNLDFNLTFPQE